MSEKGWSKRILFAGIVAIVCAALYAWGGMEMKWLRRYLASAVFFIVVCILKRDFKPLFFYPILVLGFCMGYGADSTMVKVLLRASVGVMTALGSSLLFVVLYKQWFVLIVQFLLCVGLYVYLGVFNPFNTLLGGARLEEFVLGMAVFTFPLLISAVGASNEQS
jgi:hypothetical protein